jgi:hypothetical protein
MAVAPAGGGQSSGRFAGHGVSADALHPGLARIEGLAGGKNPV